MSSDLNGTESLRPVPFIDRLLRPTVFVVPIVLTLAGIHALRTSRIGTDVTGALRGIGSQLAITASAAILVLIAVALIVGVGATLMRLVRGTPFANPLDAIAFGLVGGVLLGTGLLCVLGSFGLFVWPAVAVALIFVAFLARGRASPLVDRVPSTTGRRLPAPAWVLIALTWCAPLALQLASPVVPFRDVFPNHIAPVEFVRTYHWFPTLFTSPAPEYGPSRQILGYLGLLATTTRLTGLAAVLTAAAFALPLTLLFAVALYRFAETRIGEGTGVWALIVMPLTFTFLRLPDARGTDLAVVLALVAFLPLGELSPVRRTLVRAVALAAVLYVHPLLGGLTLGMYGAVALWFVATERNEDEDAGRAAADFPVAAALAAIAFAFPELVVELVGRDLPSWVVVLAPPLGYLTVRATLRIRFPARAVGFGVLALAIVGVTLTASVLGPRIWSSIAEEAKLFPLVTVGFFAFLVGARRHGKVTFLVAALAIGTLVHVGGTFLPTTSVFWNGMRYEISVKTNQYWTPTFLALGTAGALRIIWTSAGRKIACLAVAVFLAVTAYPFGRQGTIDVDDTHERRFSETLSIDLNKAQLGAWLNWPDNRLVINEQQRQLVNVFRAEQLAGRMTRHTRVIHIAQTHQNWDSTPFSSFAGVYETNLSREREISGHTIGGRLYRYGRLRVLAGPVYEYAVLEPAGVPPAMRQRLLGAGYRPIFANARGEIFRWMPATVED